LEGTFLVKGPGPGSEGDVNYPVGYAGKALVWDEVCHKLKKM